MNKINLLFTLYSATAIIVIIERLLPATRLKLPPYDFIRLHEINQTVIFLTITVVLGFLQLKIITKDFQALKNSWASILAAIFVAGAYLYGAGEGWHEIASFTLNTYCAKNYFLNTLCGGLFINDYYAGNIIFFIGAVMMSFSLLALSARLPFNAFNKKDTIILLLNSIIYAFTWFAYAAFDEVLVGLFFSGLLMLISIYYFLKIRKIWKSYPYITYSALAYTLSTIATLIIKLRP